MTDDLTRGYEEQNGSVTESAEATQTETGAEGTAAVIGQANETVVVNRPGPGQTVEIQAAPGQTYVLNFAPGAAQVQVDGDNFILAFDDNGDGTPDSQVVFLDLATVVDSGGETPSFQVAGVDIPSETLVAQALELAGQGETLDDVAAGPGATGGGGSTYSDNLGDILDLLAAQGVIPPVELQFGLIELENEIVLPALEGQNPMLINEIGVGVALRIPDLPGGPPPVDEGGPYAETFVAREGYGKEPVEKFNFIELVNNSDGDFNAGGNVIQILNPAGDVVSFTIPNPTVVPAGGTVVFYQSASDPELDGETIYVRIFDAAGNVVGGEDLSGEDFWALGMDTTFPIAVNLVDGGDSVDAFAANVTQADLGGLTGNPLFEGAPAGFGDPLLNLNFETFNGQFTGNHHIFSRVNLTDTNSQADWTTNNTPTDGLLNDTTLVDGGEGGPDLNPWDPLNDDLNPGQVNADPLAGQTYARLPDDTDGKLEGFGGNDALLGQGGNDSLYGGSEEMYLDQSGKVLDQFFQLLFGYEIFDDGAAGLEHEPYFSDHNDFLFGQAGDDHMYGGSGGDFMIGGEGDDSMDGGTGDDQIYGDGHETIGGMPVDGEGSGDYGAVVHGDDVIAGDALNNISGLLFDLFGDESGEGGDDTGEGGEGGNDTISSLVAAETDGFDLPEIEEGDIGAAIAIMGGNDTIYAGKGDDKASGDALATGEHVALAFSYSDDSIKRPEDGKYRHDAGFGNDVIKGDEGNDSLAGDAGAIIDGSEGGFALAVAKNFAIHGKSGAEVGSDFIKGGDGNDLIAGEALADGGEGGDAIAVSYNKADGSWHPYKGKQGGDAGNDTIFGDGGEGSYGHDSIAGDAAAVGYTATAKAFNDADDKKSDAGNDHIYSGRGDDVVAGDALAIGDAWALAKAYNTADDDAEAGNDKLNLGSGDNVFSGDALAIENGGRRIIKQEDEIADRSAYAFNTADDGGEAGNDQISALWGDDLGAGDAADISKYGDAHAHVENDAKGRDSDAGNDTIFTDGGHDTVAGDALAKGMYNALAKVKNDGDWGGDAGNDKIIADTYPWSDNDDEVAGDAMALSMQGDATAIADNKADDNKSDAGNDTIWAGSGDNIVAGDAMAQTDGGEGAEAKAYVNNTAKDGSQAGNDEILTGSGEDIVSGGSQAIAFWGEAKADTDNKATGYNSDAGNDYIDVDGGWWNKVAGDAQAIGKVAKAEGNNDAYDGDGNDAGNDTIKAGWGSDTISGDAQAIGGYYAEAKQDNHAGGKKRGDDDRNEAGNDKIIAGNGHNAVAGDAQAIALYGTAKADSHNHADKDYGNSAGNDEIFTGKHDDTVSGDAQAVGKYYAESKSENKGVGDDGDNNAGNDLIKVGDGDNLVAGDSQAISSHGSATAYGKNVADDDWKNDAGNDTIKSGDDKDTISGGAMAVAAASAYAKQENDADDGSEAGNDWISSDYDVYWKYHDDDQVAGDAMAVSKGWYNDDATAKAYNDADDGAKAGSDTIHAGGGDNVISGDAMAVNTGDDAYAYANNTADEGGVAGDDKIYAGWGNDIASGDAQALAADYAYAEANNTATGGTNAGNDEINVDGGWWNKVAGDAQAISTGGNAKAKGDNKAKYGDGTQAGNDSLYAGSGDDTMSGGAQAIAKYSAEAKQENHAGDHWRDDWNKAGNDYIDGGEGNNVIAGDAQAISDRDDAQAYSHNHADGGEGNKAGDDRIFTQKGDDVISGDAQAIGKYYAEAKSENKAEGKDDNSAGNDYIKAGDGDNRVAGDAMAIASYGVAKAYGNNTAWKDSRNDAGNDTIKTGDDEDTVSGGALAIAKKYALADQDNTAYDGAQAGDDEIYTDYDAPSWKHDDDKVSGDALAISKGGDRQSAEAEASNFAKDWGSRAGNDKIDAGYGDNVISGDALAINTGFGEAWAYAYNTAEKGGWAGNDTIHAGDGQHIIGGDAAALALSANPQYGDPRAFAYNKASGKGSHAGNDEICVGDGTGPWPAISIWVQGRNGQDGPQINLASGITPAVYGHLLSFYGSIIAGDAVTTGAHADAEAVNEVAPDYQHTYDWTVAAGNDTIHAGNGGHVISGDALAVGLYADATARNVDGDWNAYAVAGSDSIVSGNGNDLIAGDAMATAEGNAYVYNDINVETSEKVSADTIRAGDGDDTVAGDALSVNGLAYVDHGGDDEIHGNGGHDLIAGDALALGDGSTDVVIGGDDTIFGGAGNDTIFGETNYFGDFTTGGNDYIDGGAGTWDVIYGQSGNDTIVFDADDEDGGGFVSGGSDYDTLLIDENQNNDIEDGTDDGIIDFTKLDNDWVDFEELDMTDSAGDDEIVLNASDILSMTGDGILEINGDAGDTVNLNSFVANDWGVQSVGATHTIYVNNIGDQVSIENELTVNLNTTF